MTNAEKVENYIKDAGGTIDEDGSIKGDLTIFSGDIVEWVKELKYGFYILNGKPCISNWEPSKPKKEGEMTCRKGYNYDKSWRGDSPSIKPEDAKEIQRYIEEKGGQINRDGSITGNIDLYSRVISPWMQKFNASFWIKCGKPCISNWVPPLPVRNFEVNVEGCVTECEVEGSVSGIRSGLTVRAKEIKDC